MKHLRSMLASLVAIVMVFAMGATAFAAEGSNTHSISLNNNDTHKYRVYQVLTGTLAEEGESELGNPAWGADVKANPGNVNDFITSITATNDEQTIANLVFSKIDTSKGQGTVDKDNPIDGLPTGYYIMVDVTNLDNPDFKYDTQARHVVKVVNDIENMAIKWGTTEDDKIIVSDTLGPNTNNLDEDAKTDNVSVGDTVNYQITAKIPEIASTYNYFFFIVNDTLDEGLTLTENSIKVSIDNVDLVADTNYILKTGDAAKPCSFQVGLKDAKSYAGKDVVVTYSAVLNEKAEIGETPNKNTSTVKYSNNPNHVYDGNNSPGFPAEADDKATGVTPVTETETYTTGIEIQKVDEKGNVLTGATFELSGDSIQTVLTVEENFVEDATGKYYKLKDGTYTKTAPTADKYMVKADSGATAGYVIDDSYTGTDKVVVDSITYRPYVPETDGDKEVYILHNGNADLYESTETKYKKTTTKSAHEVSETKKYAKAVDDSNGLVRFDGLGAGTYTIKETVTPAGYNTLADLEVTVTFAAGKDPVWSFSGGEGAYDADEGIYKIKIENNKGTALPSTGGIGTTIFYVVGGVMVAGAVVFLLTKRRMAGNE